MAKCKDCRDTGKITLLRSVVDCDCVRREFTATPNSYSYPQSFPNDSKLRNGWFSLDQSRMRSNGGIMYELADSSGKVTITEVTTKPKPSGNWTDYVFVGIVKGLC